MAPIAAAFWIPDGRELRHFLIHPDRKLRRYFPGDAAFTSPDIYGFLDAEGYTYAIRLKANAVLQDSIAHLLSRPVGRPPNHVRRIHASASYQAGSWGRERRVVAKVEWHPGELYPRVGFIVTNLSRPAEWVVAFYNQRSPAEQHIKEGKNAIRWTRLSIQKLRNNEVHLQLHALFSFMPWLTISAISCGRWLSRRK
jgi:Transposase DDE domain group 1